MSVPGSISAAPLNIKSELVQNTTKDLFILVGEPLSWASTYATYMVNNGNSQGHAFVVIKSDVQGDSGLEDEARKQLELGKSVIIDGINLNETSQRELIENLKQTVGKIKVIAYLFKKNSDNLSEQEIGPAKLNTNLSEGAIDAIPAPALRMTKKNLEDQQMIVDGKAVRLFDIVYEPMDVQRVIVERRVAELHEYFSKPQKTPGVGQRWHDLLYALGIIKDYQRAEMICATIHTKLTTDQFPPKSSSVNVEYATHSTLVMGSQQFPVNFYNIPVGLAVTLQVYARISTPCVDFILVKLPPECPPKEGQTLAHITLYTVPKGKPFSSAQTLDHALIKPTIQAFLDGTEKKKTVNIEGTELGGEIQLERLTEETLDGRVAIRLTGKTLARPDIDYLDKGFRVEDQQNAIKNFAEFMIAHSYSMENLDQAIDHYKQHDIETKKLIEQYRTEIRNYQAEIMRLKIAIEGLTLKPEESDYPYAGAFH